MNILFSTSQVAQMSSVFIPWGALLYPLIVSYNLFVNCCLFSGVLGGRGLPVSGRVWRLPGCGHRSRLLPSRPIQGRPGGNRPQGGLSTVVRVLYRVRILPS